MKVCLVLDSESPMHYHVREIKSLINSKHEISLVLIDKKNDKEDWRKKSLLLQAIDFAKHLLKGNFMVLIFWERLVAKWIHPKSTVHEKFKEQAKREHIFEKYPDLGKREVIPFKPQKVSRLKYDFPESIIQKIKKKCDVVALLGFNKILTGKILNTPEYGVLSFHGADINKYRGRPGQFFEWINDEKRVGMTLQRLGDELDGGEIVVLRHADIRDAKSWEEVRVRCMGLRGDMLAEGLDKLEKGYKPLSPDPAKLSYEKEGHELKNVFKCIKKNITKRYFT